MKFVISVCFVIFNLTAYSHMVIVGTGKGAVIKDDMAGLRPGDTLAIRAGLYEKGGSFSNLNGITITNYQGVVDFGATVNVGKLQKVTIAGNGFRGEHYGFRFRDFKQNAFFLIAPCRYLKITHCEYRNLDGAAFNASQFFIVYTGDSSTFALYKISFQEQKLVNSGPLFIGSWAPNKKFENVVDSISFLNIIVDSTMSDVFQVQGNSIYRMLASHWRITGPCPNGKHDAGIFNTSGNGTVCNIYRKDGYGYIWRCWCLSLNGRAESYLFNCIDLNTDNYGTIDTRIQAEDTSVGNPFPFVRGANMHVLNNTVGNKRTSTYVSQIVVAGDFCSSSGYRLEIRNNIAFNTIATGADQLVKQNTADPLTDTSNNLYAKDPIAAGILLDTIQCRLNPDGPAINRAISYSFIPADIDGIPRPLGRSDIGAREYPEGVAIPSTNHGGFPHKWQILIICLAVIGLVLLPFFRMFRRKAKKTENQFSALPAKLI